jgi:hypothetical protein
VEASFYAAWPNDFNQLSTVCFVIPNLQNDMHDGSNAQGYAWLQAIMDRCVTWSSSNNSLFILTFNEDDGSQGNQISTLFLGAGREVTTCLWIITMCLKRSWHWKASSQLQIKRLPFSPSARSFRLKAFRKLTPDYSANSGL